MRSVWDELAGFKRRVAARFLVQRATQEFDAVLGDLVLRRLDPAPDGGGAGDDLYVFGEGLDHHVSLIFDGFEGGSYRAPVGVILTRGAAIGSGSVQETELRVCMG